MARIYAGSQGLDLLRAILNCAPLLRTALLRTVLINCCERFSRATVSGSTSNTAQAGRRQGSRSEQGDGVRLSRLAVWEGSSGRPKGNCGSGCNGASESKGGSENDSHCHSVQRVGAF